MFKTYEELIRDTDFTQRVFNRIGKIFPNLSNWEAYNNNIENMPLSMEDKEKLDFIEIDLDNDLKKKKSKNKIFGSFKKLNSKSKKKLANE